MGACWGGSEGKRSVGVRGRSGEGKLVANEVGDIANESRLAAEPIVAVRRIRNEVMLTSIESSLVVVLCMAYRLVSSEAKLVANEVGDNANESRLAAGLIGAVRRIRNEVMLASNESSLVVVLCVANRLGSSEAKLVASEVGDIANESRLPAEHIASVRRIRNEVMLASNESSLVAVHGGVTSKLVNGLKYVQTSDFNDFGLRNHIQCRLRLIKRTFMTVKRRSVEIICFDGQ